MSASNRSLIAARLTPANLSKAPTISPAPVFRTTTPRLSPRAIRNPENSRAATMSPGEAHAARTAARAAGRSIPSRAARCRPWDDMALRGRSPGFEAAATDAMTSPRPMRFRHRATAAGRRDGVIASPKSVSNVLATASNLANDCDMRSARPSGLTCATIR